MADNNKDIILALISTGGFCNDSVEDAIRESALRLSQDYLSPSTPAPRHEAAVSGAGCQPMSPVVGELRFSDFGAKGCFYVGSYPHCDLILKTKEITPRHFSLTFDSKKRLIISLRNSTPETLIEYEGQLFSSLARDPGGNHSLRYVLNGCTPLEGLIVKVTLPGHLSINIQVICGNISSQTYIENVNGLKLQKRASQGSEQLERLGRMALYTAPVTRAPSEMPTMGPTGNFEYYIKRKLGRRSNGSAKLLFNVKTGHCLVLKEPVDPGLLKPCDVKAWEDEASHLELGAHAHVVKLLSKSFDPHPQLYMEYAEKGTLEDVNSGQPLSRREVWSCTLQIMSAIVHLHGLGVAHRDLKPDNVFVFKREKGGIVVKIGDFGRAKVASEMHSRTGHHRYVGPEMYTRLAPEMRGMSGPSHAVYNKTVDLWPVGVMAYEYLYGLPRFDGLALWNQPYADEWHKRIVKKLTEDLEHNPKDKFLQVIARMVVIEPSKRIPVRKCYDDLLMMGSENYGEQRTEKVLASPWVEGAGLTPGPTVVSVVDPSEPGPSDRRRSKRKRLES